MAKKKTEIDRVIEANEAKIRELTCVNDALKAVQDAKRKLRKPKPLSAVEAVGGRG